MEATSSRAANLMPHMSQGARFPISLLYCYSIPCQFGAKQGLGTAMPALSESPSGGTTCGHLENGTIRKQARSEVSPHSTNLWFGDIPRRGRQHSMQAP